MNRDQFVTTLKARLKNFNDPTLDQHIITEMDLVQESLLERNGEFIPWFLLEESATTSTNTQDERVALPPDFLGEWEEGLLWWKDSEGTLHPLNREDYAVLAQQWSGKGAPKAYTMGNKYFFIFPTPDDTYTLRMFYYAQDTLPSSLSGSEENLWLKHAADWFIGEIGQIIAPQYLGDPNAGQIFGSQLGRGRKRVYNEHIARMEENKNRVMGGVY